MSYIFGQKFGNSDHSANVGFLRVSFFLVKGGVIKKKRFNGLYPSVVDMYILEVR